MTTQTYTGTLTILHCCNCGVPFGIGEDFESRRRKDHNWFYCPEGHAQHYSGETKEERLKCDLRAAEARASNNRERYLLERRTLIATKGHVTRLRRKVAAGRCPCCKTEFPDLAEHMKWKHPDFEK